MFTGIIEDLGIISNLEKEGKNLHITLKSKITNELKIDQSLAHNGICLTVVKIKNDSYTVTAIDETIIKTNIKYWSLGDKVNLERSLLANGRVDGHFVQGHVDCTAEVKSINEQNGSWEIRFDTQNEKAISLMVDKGSVCINGVSLTLVNIWQKKGTEFSVAIIPYTFEHTNFNNFKVGTIVNIEFDVLGKYIQRHLNLRQESA